MDMRTDFDLCVIGGGSAGLTAAAGAAALGAKVALVERRRLSARNFVSATGSRPAVPNLPGLAAVPYLTIESVFELRESVPRLLVLGGGPMGVEFAQAFALPR